MTEFLRRDVQSSENILHKSLHIYETRTRLYFLYNKHICTKGLNTGLLNFRNSAKNTTHGVFFPLFTP